VEYSLDLMGGLIFTVRGWILIFMDFNKKVLALLDRKHEWFRNDPRFEDHFLNRCSLPKLRSEAQSAIKPDSSSREDAPRPTL
jgi:hypothetical protein